MGGDFSRAFFPHALNWHPVSPWLEEYIFERSFQADLSRNAGFAQRASGKIRTQVSLNAGSMWSCFFNLKTDYQERPRSLCQKEKLDRFPSEGTPCRGATSVRP